ncbi:low molecular weight protein arginine phosphatase [soil metagenome]
MDTFSIAFVCTGNRFRSPLAAAFVDRLAVGLPVSTQSYGTLPLEGAPALPEAVEIARSCGVSLAKHRSRYLDNASLTDVDLLIGFEPLHVQQAVVDAQAARERSFMLRDLISLLAGAGPAASDEDAVRRARSLVARAGERAADAPSLRASEMRDPFGGPWKVYRQSAAEIRELSIELAQLLFGVGDSRRLAPVPEKPGRGRATLRR